MLRRRMRRCVRSDSIVCCRSAEHGCLEEIAVSLSKHDKRLPSLRSAEAHRTTGLAAVTASITRAVIGWVGLSCMTSHGGDFAELQVLSNYPE
jgi:hypothetical protein